jgi:hypothetical protein
MFCMDVKGLYPSVPKSEGLEACRKALKSKMDHEIPTEEILTIIDLVLTHNNFSFQSKHYVQTEGTAIGSRLGMNYACTYMGEWERQLLSATDKTPLPYRRYVDDIWGLWQHASSHCQWIILVLSYTPLTTSPAQICDFTMRFHWLP